MRSCRVASSSSSSTGDRALGDDRPGVDAVVDEEQRAAGDLDPVRERVPRRRACRGTTGSSAGWVLTYRPPNAAEERWPDQLHEAGETTRSGSYAATASVERARPRPRAVGEVLDPADERRDAGALGPGQPLDAARSAPTATTCRAVRRVGRRRPAAPAGSCRSRRPGPPADPTNGWRGRGARCLVRHAPTLPARRVWTAVRPARLGENARVSNRSASRHSAAPHGPLSRSRCGRPAARPRRPLRSRGRPSADPAGARHAPHAPVRGAAPRSGCSRTTLDLPWKAVALLPLALAAGGVRSLRGAPVPVPRAGPWCGSGSAWR